MSGLSLELLRYSGSLLMLALTRLLKPEFQPELEFAAGGGAGNAADVLSSAFFIEDLHALLARQVKIGAVEHIEKFNPKVERRTLTEFRNPHALDHGEVHDGSVGSLDSSPAEVT